MCTSAAVELLALPLAGTDVVCAEQQAFTSEQIDALLEDRRIREQEAQAASLILSQQLESVLARLSKAEERLRTATRDHILGKPLCWQRVQDLCGCSSHLALSQQLESVLARLSKAD